MYVYSKLIAIIFTFVCLLNVSSCAYRDHTTKDQSLYCIGNGECNLTGKLTINVNSYGAVGVLDQGSDCLAIALPKTIVSNKNRWHEKDVEVDGILFSNGSALGVISYTLEDRDVLVGYCNSENILYLTNIRDIQN